MLTGGVGGARFLRGVVEAVDPAETTAIVNVGDDLEFLGLDVSPDLDSVLYALAGVSDDERGWGRADETWNAIAEVERLGGEAWFRLSEDGNSFVGKYKTAGSDQWIEWSGTRR